MESMKVKTNDAVSFGVTLLLHPDEDDKGLKLKKVGKKLANRFKFGCDLFQKPQ